MSRYVRRVISVNGCDLSTAFFPVHANNYSQGSGCAASAQRGSGGGGSERRGQRGAPMSRGEAGVLMSIYEHLAGMLTHLGVDEGTVSEVGATLTAYRDDIIARTGPAS